MRVKNIALISMITGCSLVSGCSKQASKTYDKLPKAFSTEFYTRDSIVTSKVDSLKKIGLNGNKTERDLYLNEFNNVLEERVLLDRIKNDSILRALQGQIDSLKQVVKSKSK